MYNVSVYGLKVYTEFEPGLDLKFQICGAYAEKRGRNG